MPKIGRQIRFVLAEGERDNEVTKNGQWLIANRQGSTAYWLLMTDDCSLLTAFYPP